MAGSRFRSGVHTPQGTFGGVGNADSLLTEVFRGTRLYAGLKLGNFAYSLRRHGADKVADILDNLGYEQVDKAIGNHKK